MGRINNLKPAKCEKLLEKYGWEFVNRKGTHATFYKVINGKDSFVQVIWNNKTIYWKNAKVMIDKTDIPEEIWINKCK